MEEVLFNKDWLFWEDKDAFSLLWTVPEDARQVHLPHDPMIHAAAVPASPAGGGGAFRNGGSYVYYKTFTISEEGKDKIWYLRFDGISAKAMVYINNQRAALVPYGYTTFYTLLNDYLYYDRPNQIRVQARTGDMPNSRWYTGAGIYRDVYLAEGEQVYIMPQDIHVITEDASPELAVLEVRCKVKNHFVRHKTCRIVTEIYDPNGVLSAQEITDISVPGAGEDFFRQHIIVADPMLWSDETPFLYCCRICLETDSGRDVTETTFGIRSLSLDARRGLRVNGRSVKLRGACIHHDSGLLGAATYAEAEFRRVRLLKEAGFNAVRSAHNPLAPVTLNACDRLGMFVMDEAFDTWTRSKSDYDYSQVFEKWWQDDITAMVKKDLNHPSVIMYSIGNEIPEIASSHGSLLGRKIAELIRSLDPTRYVTAGINGIYSSGKRFDELAADILDEKTQAGTHGNVNDFITATFEHADEIVTHRVVSRNLELAGASLDILGYNYMTARYEMDGKDYPNRVIVGSETYAPEIARNWEIISRMNHVIGDFTWTGWDYLGEAGAGIVGYHFGEGGFGAQYPCQLAYVGDFDITGFRRPMSYYREIVFGRRNDPYITVQSPAHYKDKPMLSPWVFSDNNSSWTYPGWEEQPVIVEVYSPGDEVELLLNGSSLGRKPSGRGSGFRILFDTIYNPGELKAVAYRDGQIIGSHSLSTAKDASKIRILVEESEGLPERELIYISVVLEDTEGNCCPVNSEFFVKVCGDAVLAAVGSGDPKPLHGYTEHRSNLFFGRGLIILRTTEKHGQCEAKITVEGLGTVSKEIAY